MKKNFMYFACALLSLLVLGGTMKSWAGIADKPDGAPDVNYSWTFQDDVVQYKVTDYATVKDASNKDLRVLVVEISGLDYTGVTTKPENLNIKTVGTMKYGNKQFTYIVKSIAGTTPAAGESFYAQRQLKSVVFSNDESLVKDDQFTVTIGEYAFFGCDAMTTLTLPDNVSSIGARAFEGSAITSFVIPSKCKTLGQYAFNDTQKLKDVTVSENGNNELTTIEKKVFANSYVETLDLHKAYKLSEIQDDAFIFEASKINNQLKEVTLPEGKIVSNEVKTPSLFKNLGSAFANCTALTTINNLEKSVVTNIRRGTVSGGNPQYAAFENCKSLTELYLPKTASIEGTELTKEVSAFYGCEKLATLKFADGWCNTIGSNIYQGKKRNADGVTFAALSPAEQEAQKSYLTTVSFEGTIAGDATTGATISTEAFMDCANLATLTFTDGWALATASTVGISINARAFKNTALTTVNFNGISFVNAGATLTNKIEEEAFACPKLESVEFGDISYDGDILETFTLHPGAFKSNVLKKVTFGAITATNPSNSILEIGQTSGTIPVFGKYQTSSDPVPDVLEVVTFDKITAGYFTIFDNAFKSKALKTVTIGDIATIAFDKGGSLNIGKYAFGFEEAVDPDGAQEKTVTIGSIGATPKDGTSTTATLTVTFDDYAFAGQLLKKVKIGNVKGGAVVTANQYAFANLTANTDKFTAMKEEVEIGDVTSNDNKEVSVTLVAKSFLAPQKKASEFAVTIGNIAGLDGYLATVTAATNSFYAPQNGGKTADGENVKTTYTLGNINAYADLTSLAYGSFVGSTDAETSPTNTTSVTIGEVATTLSYPPFTNVYDATVGKWACASRNLDLAVFQGVVEATVGDIVTTATISDSGSTLESMEFSGNVADANAIGVFNSTKVRLIAFTADDPEVAVGAVSAGAFEKASDYLAGITGTKEQIVLVYKTKTSSKSKAILNVAAFNASEDGNKNVVLYTDDWTKNRIFLNTAVYPTVPYRLDLSASDVVPGQDITATCYVQEGGKYAYGRLYVPAGIGMYYKVSADKTADGKNNVTLYSANNDGKSSDIYMVPVSPIDGWYYIDATEASQTLIVRSAAISDAEGGKVTVKAEAATAEDIKMIADDPDLFWFDEFDASKNALRYATEAVANQNLQNNAEFSEQSIYVMANPVKNGLAFALLNQYTTSRNLAKNSIYVVVKKLVPAKAAARLTVIWPEDVEEGATAIQSVKNASVNEGEIYNLQGVRVNAAYKGVVIKNGKKMIQK